MFISYLSHSNLDPLLIALVECSIFIFMIIFQTILTMETYYYFHARRKENRIRHDQLEFNSIRLQIDCYTLEASSSFN